ncbi:MAG: class I adenylate-forming enzyme family protein [Bradymonadaceae bacterium]
MSGYLGEDQQTDDEEWMTVEDLGYLDEEGYLYLAGRSRDMVISGGVNIYPVEIEDALVEHPEVEDAGVIGVDDEEWGEKLVGYVVPADGAIEIEGLESWLRERLAGYKIPKDWRVIDELPRNPTGKIEKNELEKQYNSSD